MCEPSHTKINKCNKNFKKKKKKNQPLTGWAWMVLMFTLPTVGKEGWIALNLRPDWDTQFFSDHNILKQKCILSWRQLCGGF